MAVLLKKFSSKTSKFRHSVTKKRQLLGDFVPRPPTGALPLDPTGGLPSSDPLGPLLSHILNMPLFVVQFWFSDLYVSYPLSTRCPVNSSAICDVQHPDFSLICCCQWPYISIVQENAWMSKITNDGLTRSDKGCFKLYPYGNSGR